METKKVYFCILLILLMAFDAPVIQKVIGLICYFSCDTSIDFLNSGLKNRVLKWCSTLALYLTTFGLSLVLHPYFCLNFISRILLALVGLSFFCIGLLEGLHLHCISFPLVFFRGHLCFSKICIQAKLSEPFCLDLLRTLCFTQMHNLTES